MDKFLILNDCLVLPNAKIKQNSFFETIMLIESISNKLKV